MSTLSGSNAYARARRSAVVASPTCNHATIPAATSSRQQLRSHKQNQVIMFCAFTLCGIIFFLVEILLLRASLVYPTKEEVAESSASKKQHPESAAPDGTFNGYPIYYRNVSDISYTKPCTLLHCVGENFQSDSWKHRSCHFQFFCFNVTNRKFQIYQRREDRTLLEWSQQIPLMTLSGSLLSSNSTTTTTLGVSLGGINLKWHKDVQRLQWFPKVLSEPPTEFYALPEKVVMIPFHSLGGWNPGHAVWDDLLPMFSLMQIFQFSTDTHEILALRYHLEGLEQQGGGLWASCEASEHVVECERMQLKFWPLLNNHSNPRTQQNVKLEVDGILKTDLVCAKQGLAGIGDLTDHGIKKVHGWQPEDYQSTHNHGRGGLFWKFRNFCLNNLGINTDSSALRQPPYRIVFSVDSSHSSGRKLDFTTQYKFLSQALGDEGVDAEISTVVLKDLSLTEQVQLVTEASIFITGCGGGTVTSTFLPKGAAVIIYYNEAGGLKRNQMTGLPARLDWDFFNHLSYLHVHWFPRLTMGTQEDLNALFHVVRSNLHRQTHMVPVE